ncbi:MAG: lysylphosphatidylglycerol synthase transmembrane domain-containing protein [Halothece sp.]
MKNLVSFLKPYLRWFILGATLFFLADAFKNHWSEVTAIEIGPIQGLMLAIACFANFVAYVWSGFVWYIVLRSFDQSVPLEWVVRVQLKTNIAKYLPGNIWHFYGRISALRKAGASMGAAMLSVLLEPVLMAAAGLVIAFSGIQLGVIVPLGTLWNESISILGLVGVLTVIHPRILNPILKILSRAKSEGNETQVRQLKRYPGLPLLGQLVFALLRGTGFIMTLAAFTPISSSQLPLLLTAFSMAWFLSLVVPIPGGLGVFETTAIALLDSEFPLGILLSVLALFRLVTILAEAIAAFLAWLREKTASMPL